MKGKILEPVIVLMLVGLIATVNAVAQITAPMTFKTSFPFVIGNTKFPAGTYSIRPLENEEDVMELTSADGKTAALFETMMAELRSTPSKGEVVFKKYDNNYVLSEIFEAGSKIGAMSLKTHAERQYAKKSSAPTKESVALTKGP